MKRSFFLLNFLLFFMIFTSGAQQVPTQLAHHPEIPKLCKGEVFISHAGYSVLYKEEHEQASWVASNNCGANGRGDVLICKLAKI